MESAFSAFLSASGYVIMGDYEADITITEYNQVVRYDGEMYRAAAATSLPFTTTTWGTDEASFVALGDAVLRQEIGEGIRRVDDIAALRGTPGRFVLDAAYVVEEVRRGTFRWDASDLSDEVTADVRSGVFVALDSDPTGASGAWVRQFGQAFPGFGQLKASWFNTADDWSDAIQAGNDYIVAMGRKQKLHLPTYTLTMLDEVIIDVSYVSLIGNCTVLDFAALTEGYAATFTGSIDPPYGQAVQGVDGI
jgi:hypothetical protein